MLIIKDIITTQSALDIANIPMDEVKNLQSVPIGGSVPVKEYGMKFETINGETFIDRTGRMAVIGFSKKAKEKMGVIYDLIIDSQEITQEFIRLKIGAKEDAVIIQNQRQRIKELQARSFGKLIKLAFISLIWGKQDESI